MYFSHGFERFLTISMWFFAILSGAGIVSGILPPQEMLPLFCQHLQEWLSLTALSFCNTWVLLVMAIGILRIAKKGRTRNFEKEWLGMIGKLEVLFYPVSYPFTDPETKQLTVGIFPRRNFEKLLELRPSFTVLFPQNKTLNQLISQIAKEDQESRIGDDNPEIFFQSSEVKILAKKLMKLSDNV
ncbi:hypothetical protein FAI40_03955 [Acetobacteraceae bacterium]|nr:hypothetical protein FAI40_03955 [Acetobacteraceae bacterium]